MLGNIAVWYSFTNLFMGGTVNAAANQLFSNLPNTARIMILGFAALPAAKATDSSA